MSESGLPSLSVRERQLLKLAAGGYTNTAIANQLGITESTVSTYWRRIRTKIGSSSRTELVAKVLRGEMEQTVGALRAEHLAHESAETASSEFYRALIEHAPDAILIISSGGQIRVANDAAADLFGWEPDALHGRHISDLVPPRYREIHGLHMKDFIEAPNRREMGDHMSTYALHRSGAEFRIAANLAAVGEGQETAFICIIRYLQSPK